MMTDQPERISRDQAKAALVRSGYLLESRLETVLQDRDYHVEASAAYADPLTGTSRELDLYAITQVPLADPARDALWGVLLIECVNNPQPFAFITKESRISELYHEEIKMAGLPVQFPSDGRWERLADALQMNEYHHYCTERIATQWCSFSQKKNKEWMACHDDQHFSDLSKLSAAVEYFVARHFDLWMDGSPKEINLEFYYPLLVVQGDLLEVRARKRSLRLAATNHVQFRRSLATSAGERSYQIDVVTERYLPTFLGIVDQELQETVQRLRRRYREATQVVGALRDRICGELPGMIGSDRIREILDEVDPFV